ncbi:uncharacterized protein LOC115794946 isoform X2 [Archocentrus centrarchus]|uniref:uncharacterized protein LOC115794946 isoform X2 n=1 Tax=Archocentrus centrarchus TaxID=63155 RepID=UPI0011E9C6A7|nr:uncharacterized protein LOC115794946 isoform X2 [Archocentrus centrarchus]
MTTKKLLIETLNQLSPEDFAEFKSITGVEKKFRFFFKRKLKAENTQDVVELMKKKYGQGCVEETRKALMKMSRTDLVQRLSDKQFPALSQRVETMESLIELLLETLADLSDSEFEDLKEILRRNCGFLQLMEIEESDLQDTVFSMVQTYGHQSVKKIMELLKDIERSDLAQRLSDCSSEPKKKHLDEHLSAVIHKQQQHECEQGLMEEEQYSYTAPPEFSSLTASGKKLFLSLLVLLLMLLSLLPERKSVCAGCV